MNTSTKHFYDFDSEVKKIEYLSNQLDSGRRNFESAISYEKRISKNRKKLNLLTSKTFKYTSLPDEVNIDWSNSLVTVKKTMPLRPIRSRGMGNDNKEIIIKLLANPQQARKIKTFKNQILLTVLFSFTANRQLLIQSIEIEFNGDNIYHE
ncbi:MAG: hypothetical protein OCD00_12860 [Colwellia sp.]